MGEKGLSGLTGFLAHHDRAHIAKVVLARDSSVVDDFSADLEAVCIKHKLTYSYRDALSVDIDCDFALAISWRWMLPMSTPLIVLHDSLLPRYRGFAPLVNMLINGESTLGVTALLATQAYDNGPIIEQASVQVGYPLKIQSAIDCLLPLYAELVDKVCSRALTGKSMSGIAQDSVFATYSPWRDSFDYRIIWHQEAAKIRRFVDAVGAPYLGSIAYCGSKKLIIHEVVEESDVVIESRSEHLGKVLFREGDEPIVICGTGLLRIKRACYEGSTENCVGDLPFRSRFTTEPFVS